MHIHLFKYWISRIVYDLCLHPLSKYKGPLLWSAFRFPSINSMISGDLSHRVKNTHEDHSEVVRVGLASYLLQTRQPGKISIPRDLYNYSGRSLAYLEMRIVLAKDFLEFPYGASEGIGSTNMGQAKNILDLVQTANCLKTQQRTLDISKNRYHVFFEHWEHGCWASLIPFEGAKEHENLSEAIVQKQEVASNVNILLETSNWKPWLASTNKI